MRLPGAKVGVSEGAGVSVGGSGVKISVGGRGVKVGDGKGVFDGGTGAEVGKGVSDGSAVTVSVGRGVDVETTGG